MFGIFLASHTQLCDFRLRICILPSYRLDDFFTECFDLFGRPANEVVGVYCIGKIDALEHRFASEPIKEVIIDG